MPINDFTVLTRFSEISSLAFIFLYIFRIIFASNRVFYYSQMNVLGGCHLSKTCLQSERRAWCYLVKNFRLFTLKTFDFLFRKIEVFLENSYFWIFYFFEVKVFIVCHLSKILLQSGGKVCFFIWPKTFDFLFKKHVNFYLGKRVTI